MADNSSNLVCTPDVSLKMWCAGRAGTYPGDWSIESSEAANGDPKL
jgi:hypothetical protein